LDKIRREGGQVKTVSTGLDPSPALSLTASATTLSESVHPSLPQRPAHNFAVKADSIGLGAKPTAESIQNMPTAAQALAGSNRDVVANRAAIRMANMSARDVLKAELAGASPVKPTLSIPSIPVPVADTAMTSPTLSSEDDFPGLGGHHVSMDISNDANPSPDDPDADAEGDPDPDNRPVANDGDTDKVSLGVKRKIEEVDDAGNDVFGSDDDAPADAAVVSKALKVNPDGTVEQEDTIKYAMKF
jgi:5'-3' exoribonuclease 2